MAVKSTCDFCKKDLKKAGGFLFGPPHKSGEVKRHVVCQDCYKRVIQFLKAGPKVIEDIISLGPTWLNYTRKVKRGK